jgi:hypothetical protein
MKFSAVACLLLASSASAFAPQRPAFASVGPLAMSETPEPPKEAPAPKQAPGALVAIKDETVEFTAGIIGGTAGFLVGGPLLGAIGAAAANYVSKMDSEATDVVKAVSMSSIQILNYLANIDSKYEILKKTKASLQDAVDKLKAKGTVDPDAIDKVEKALESTNKKIKEINDEYDLVGGGVTALGVVGDLVEKAILKAAELNEEYQLSAKAKQALSNAVEKAKAASQEAGR